MDSRQLQLATTQKLHRLHQPALGVLKPFLENIFFWVGFSLDCVFHKVRLLPVDSRHSTVPLASKRFSQDWGYQVFMGLKQSVAEGKLKIKLNRLFSKKTLTNAIKETWRPILRSSEITSSMLWWSESPQTSFGPFLISEYFKVSFRISHFSFGHFSGFEQLSWTILT